MASFLDIWLPRAFPELAFRCIPHEGKTDLRRSIRRKLRAWREPGVRFVVLIDNDSGDCVHLKDQILELCRNAGRADTLVRIVCQELEAWYLGDPAAVAEAYGRPDLARALRKNKFREPDRLQKPSGHLSSILPEFQKISGARKLAQHIDPLRGRSASFAALHSGLERLLAPLAPLHPEGC